MKKEYLKPTSETQNIVLRNIMVVSPNAKPGATNEQDPVNDLNAPARSLYI